MWRMILFLLICAFLAFSGCASTPNYAQGSTLTMSLPIVEVHWVDAFIDTDDYTVKSARKLKPIKRRTVGYLIAEKKSCLVLSTDYFPKGKTVKEISAVMVIPREWVTAYEIQDV